MIAFIYDQSTVMPVRASKSSPDTKNRMGSSQWQECIKTVNHAHILKKKKYYSIYKINLINFMRGEES